MLLGPCYEPIYTHYWEECDQEDVAGAGREWDPEPLETSDPASETSLLSPGRTNTLNLPSLHSKWWI